MKRTVYTYVRIFTVMYILLISFSMAIYAKTPSKRKVHEAYVQYIKNNYLPYYKTGKKIKIGKYKYEYLGLNATEVDVNKDGINELILGSWSGGARGSYSLYIFRSGKVIDTHKGGHTVPLIYKKKIYFGWSNGAADNGWTKVTIKNKGKKIKSTTYEVNSNDLNNTKYLIDNRIVSAKKFKKSLALPSNSWSLHVNPKDIETYIR